MLNSAASSGYLAAKSYQATPSRSRISAGRLDSGSPLPRAASTPHSISRPGTAASTSTFGATAAAAAAAAGDGALPQPLRVDRGSGGDRGREVGPVADLRDADAGARPRRLHEHRQAEP